MLQDIIVYLVFAVCVCLIIWRVGRRFLLKEGQGSDCSSCTADCKLRDLKKSKKEGDCKKCPPSS